MVSGSMARGSGCSSRMTNHISGGWSRRPVRPIRWRNELTVKGASIWKARSSRPMSMPSSSVAVVTVVWNWVSSFITASARLPVGGGEVAVVDEKAVGLVVGLAVLAQGGGDGLALLPGVDEDQALLPPGVLEDIAHARVGQRRGLVGLLGSSTGWAADDGRRPRQPADW